MLESRTEFSTTSVRAVFIPRTDFVTSVVATYGDRLTAAAEEKEYYDIFHKLKMLRQIVKSNVKKSYRKREKRMTKECEHDNNRILETRVTKKIKAYRRRFECKDCGHRWTEHSKDHYIKSTRRTQSGRPPNDVEDKWAAAYANYQGDLK